MQNWLSLPNRERIKETPSPTCLTLAQKALVHWAKVDDYDAILDLDCASGKLLHYYLKKFQIRACGMVSNAGELSASQSLLHTQAEVLKADKRDIPWREGSFDAVFLSKPFYNLDQSRDILHEVRRVIKPGGQFVIAVPGLHLLSRLGLTKENGMKLKNMDNPFNLMEELHQQGFTDVSMRLSSLRYATIIAHTKPSS